MTSLLARGVLLPTVPTFIGELQGASDMHNLDQTLTAQEYDFNFPGEAESEAEFLGEAENLEFAAELLGVSNEQELENFFGDLISSAGRAVSNFAKSSTGQALGGILKSAAKSALPVLGGAVGGYFGGPAGAQIGSTVAQNAGQMLGLELEGLSHDDREFEVAQQVVRLASDAARIAAEGHGAAPPAVVARNAFIQAAQTHAPGMIRPANGSGGHAGPMQSGPSTAGGNGRRSGRWQRHGSRIVLIGV
jgi:hypothetical protein